MQNELVFEAAAGGLETEYLKEKLPDGPAPAKPIPHWLSLI